MKGERPWRVGTKVGRTLYDAHGELIGVLDTPELAALAALAVNALERPDTLPAPPPFELLVPVTADPLHPVGRCTPMLATCACRFWDRDVMDVSEVPNHHPDCPQSL